MISTASEIEEDGTQTDKVGEGSSSDGLASRGPPVCHATLTGDRRSCTYHVMLSPCKHPPSRREQDQVFETGEKVV